MRKTKKRLTFAVAAAGAALAATLTGCHFPEQYPVSTLYGPPPRDIEEPLDEEKENNDPLHGGTYDPAEEEPQDIYGPPPAGLYGPPNTEQAD